MPLNLNRLNSKQREAVLHGEGPLLVLAGAGSGKTSTMTYRIAHLIAERHVPARAILGLSFTNKAAGELKERVMKLVAETAGKKAAKGLLVSTFHSLCVRVLREHGEKIGFQKNFTILDQGDQRDVLRSVLKHIKIDERKFDVDTILFQIGQSKSRFMKPEQAEQYFLENKSIGQDYAIAAASSYGRYQDQLKILNAMDFDDLLFNAVKLLEEHEDVRAHYNARFRYILVDEYQDTNAAQFKLLKLLTERQQNLCVVGDDDQSIYAWRGADPSHILSFGSYYPGARLVTLDQNYRSTTTILDAANQVIQGNRNRYDKSLWSDRGQGEPITEIVLEDDHDESEFVAEEILRRAKGESPRPWKDFAILYRSNSQSRVFEEALRRNQVPYKIVGGMSFLDRKEVKDILSYWRLVANPKDDGSLRRVLNFPARGIGKSSVEALGTFALEQGVPMFEALAEAPRLAARAAEGCARFRALIQDLRLRLESIDPSAELLAQWGKMSLEMIGARKAIEEDTDDPVQFARQWENVEELCHSLGQMSVTDLGVEVESLTGPALLQEFLSRMALDAKEEEEDKKEKDQEKDQVTLLTLHGAKGLEYPIVFLVGMEEGFLPHKRTIAEAADFSEERRLAYVGITRARDHLLLTRAKNRIRYGKPVPRVPSRFLEDIPKHLVVRTDKSLSPDFASDQAREEHETKVKNFLADIRARLTAGKSP